MTKLFELTFCCSITNYHVFNLHSKRWIPFLCFASFNGFSNLHIKHKTRPNVHFMIKYIKKDNEKYKNNVMKLVFAKCFFLMLKKIGCSLNFLKWTIKWSLPVKDGKHLVATKLFDARLQRMTSWPPRCFCFFSRLETWGPPSL